MVKQADILLQKVSRDRLVRFLLWPADDRLGWVKARRVTILQDLASLKCVQSDLRVNILLG